MTKLSFLFATLLAAQEPTTTDTWEKVFWDASAELAKIELRRQAFWDWPRRAHAAATAQLVLERNPITQTVLRVRGLDLAVWQERRPFDVDKALDLNPEWLAEIRDNTPMPDFTGRAPDRRRPDELAADNLFRQAVLFANQTPLDAFIKSSEDNKYVTFGHLWRESEKYRGQVVPVQGELLRLRREDAPYRLRVLGIKYVYEGWIKGPTEKSFPFCVVFPVPVEDKSSPTGVLEPAEKMSRKVTFYGYYIKKFRYPVQVGAGDKVKTEQRDSPMLIGPTLILSEGEKAAIPTETAAPFSKHLFMIVGGLACLIVVLLGGLTWLFRRGDRQFRERLHELHKARVVEMFEVEPEPLPDGVPGGPNSHDA